jgi:cystathionine beta-lyase
MSEDEEAHRLSTRLIHAGRKGRRTVNPPVERASTVLLPTVDQLYGGKRSPYGRMGLGVQDELRAALTELEGGVDAQLAPNGLAACALALMASVKAGGHVLITDSLYGPTRRFCERFLKRMGVESEAFPPRIGAGIAGLIRPETCAVMLESPGSLTFEIQDTPAILSVTRPAGISTIMDNTWSAGVFHRPLTLGCDYSVQALTKYVVGHADAFGGVVVAGNPGTARALAETAQDLGSSLAPDDAYLALRGLRTLPARLKLHEAAGLTLARHIQEHPAVARVLHPAFASHPDHALWQRDFTGACGLFGVILKPVEAGRLEAALNGLSLFGFGFSWGGFESLCIPCDAQLHRSHGRPEPEGPLIRIHAGLEDTADLGADLDRMLGALV